MKKTQFFLYLILTVALSLSAVTAQAQNNPFLAPQKQETVQKKSPSPFKSTTSAPATVQENKGPVAGIYNMVMIKITMLQKEIRAQLTGFARDIKKNPYGKSLWLFLAFAFMYGIVHAVGPGHGKSVVCAYFISRGGSTYSAAFMSWIITLVHVGSATVAVCLAYMLMKSGMSGFEEFNRHLQTASYGLVALIGLWLLIGALRSFNQKARHECESKGRESLKEIATVAIVTGLVPCPGAAIILVYTLSTGILPTGLLAMVFLATGMAVTTSCFALAAAKARNAMDRTGLNRSVRIVYSILSLLGATVITCFGLLMLSAHLSLV
jgi:ABC-type nickel/cobalt efflux system permease component RcnA